MSTNVRGAVAVIGTGRVGSVLAAALTEAGFPVSTGRCAAEAADLIILAVPDDALPGVVAGLPVRPGQVVAHTSGAHGIGVLAAAVARGARPLALHPAMTFTGAPDDLVRLRKGISFGVTAPPEVRPVAEALVRELGGTVEWIPEEHRPLYHAALAHGANHLVTLVNEAMDVLRAAGVGDPARILDPLLHAALDNALRHGDAALTGPVSRGDAGTVAGHLAALAGSVPDARAAYQALARRTAERAVASDRLTDARAGAVREVLG